MIEFYKKRGETPLQALSRLRKENPEYKDSILSYAGRLDPMAEGVLPILVGAEENKNRKEFLNKNKVYRAEFLIGCETDTGDTLGIIQKTNFRNIEPKVLEYAVKNLLKVEKQTYPWFSSKTVSGIPLFEYARKKNFKIVRPERKVKIYKISNIIISEISKDEIIKDCINIIQNIEGDFRQREILETWDKLIKVIPEKVQTIAFEIEVSSGTYIRALAEQIGNSINCPVLLYTLIRTRVFK